MPFDHGCRFHQHDVVQGLRPDPVKPHPEKSDCAKELRTTRALAPQDAHLMSKGNELKFNVGAATNMEREHGNESGKNRDHARNGMVAHKSLGRRRLDVSNSAQSSSWLGRSFTGAGGSSPPP